MIHHLKNILLPLFVFGLHALSLAQIMIPNPSFEDTILREFPPEPWQHLSTPDHQPGNWSVTAPAYHGNYYLGMVTRSNGTQEHTFVRVDIPAGQEWNMIFWISGTSDIYGNGGREPCRINFWVSDTTPDAPASYRKRIYQSDLAPLDGWESRIFNFSTEQAAKYLILQSEFSDPSDPTWANVFIDHLSPIYQGRIIMDAGPDTTLCEGDSLVLTSSHPDMTLSMGFGLKTDRLVIRFPGLYTIHYHYRDLVVVDSLRVQVNAYPRFQLPADTAICEGESFSVAPNPIPNATEFSWSDGLTGPERIIERPGLYELTAWKGECLFTDTIVVGSTVCTHTLEMPNVFSPNGDGYNDLFLPMEALNVIDPTWIIFDRWGREIFQSTSLHPGWDGTWHRAPMPAGTYYWVLSFLDPRQQRHIKKGYVVLLR
ncbi:MAG: gliding motility-associated C-terminal domain-containing protein [Bacteroidota bacterium]